MSDCLGVHTGTCRLQSAVFVPHFVLSRPPSDLHPQHGGASANAGTRDRHHQAHAQGDQDVYRQDCHSGGPPQKEHLESSEDQESLVTRPCTCAQLIRGAAHHHRAQAACLKGEDTL